ncbi:MAG: hypothetical protein IKZ98_15810 [Clostridia bacterium]|nr:hypothetical protein [Clostridia bacterium]
MDDKRQMQAKLIHSLSGLEENPFLARRVIAQAKGEPEMKKKISFALILAMILLVLLAVAAVAEVLGINVFEVFGKTDSRYAELAPYTTLDNMPEVSVTGVELGSTTAGINSAYYDGTSLMVGYAIRNGSCMEAFIPDDSLIAEMTRLDDNLVWAGSNEEEGRLITEWVQARNEGKKAGLVHYTVSPSDHTETDDGIDIVPEAEETRTGEDGFEYTVREYETPLTQELQNLDEITVNIRLIRSVNYLYFDGENTYTLDKTESAGVMRAKVRKTSSQVLTCRGTGRFRGIRLDAAATVSAAYASLQLHFSDPLPQLPEDHWYSFRLSDENGVVLRESECTDGAVSDVSLTYEGTGRIPQQLTLRIYEEQEGDFDLDAALSETEPIILAVQE